MKLNKITALVKKSKSFDIYTYAKNMQWICVDDAAIYPLYGFPHLTKDIEIMSILGIDVTTGEDWDIQFIDGLPGNIDFSDSGGSDGKDINLNKKSVTLSDEKEVNHWLLQPDDSEKIFFVKEKYILPVWDGDDLLRMALRFSAHSLREYVAIFHGMSLSAIILPTSAGKSVIEIVNRFTENVQWSVTPDSVQKRFSNYSYADVPDDDTPSDMEIDEEI